MADFQVIQGDCLEVMRGMEDNSVDLIATDPPYFRVKGEEWDRQWDKPEKFIEWIGELCKEWHRILKPNGSLYVFASPQMAARVEVEISKRLNPLNRIRWVKEAGWHKKASKETLRAFLSPWEEIIFFEHYGADNIAKGEAGYAAKCDELRGFIFEPLRAYLDGERERAGFTPEDCNEACGHRREGGMAGRHYFSPSQWCLPTKENYEKLRAAFNANGGEYLRKDYEELRQEYEELRRPFNVSADVPYTDVWTFKTVQAYKGRHVCEKPLDLMGHIVTASSREGDTVLDCFCGSGSTGVAAVRNGRNFIGIEKDAHWVGRAVQRIEMEAQQMQMAV